MDASWDEALSPLAELMRSSRPTVPRTVAAGAGEGIRTLDPNLGKVVLYP